MKFSGRQKTVSFKQLNTGNINEVFQLLCPTRESEWLPGWNYNMIHSNSGHIEQDCVFTTQYKNASETVWHVTQYDKANYKIEFLSVTPGELTVRINIELKRIDNSLTETKITYTYTGLNESQNEFIKEYLENEFIETMKFWEKAINYYLATGAMIRQ